MAKAFEEATQFKHNTLRGGEREEGVREFLSKQLPDRLKVTTGEAVDRYGNTSSQLDVMVYDATLNSPFAGESNSLLPAEALLAIVEVKTELTNEEWKRIAKSVEAFCRLRPYKEHFSLSKSGRENAVKPGPRCFFTVAAFSSDLSSGSSWAKKEWERACKAIGNDSCLGLNRILVLDRGIINPTEAVYRPSADQGENLLAWFVGLANFLNREVPRREPMDWQIYAGGSFGKWKPFKGN